MTVGMTSGRGNARDQFGRGNGYSYGYNGTLRGFDRRWRRESYCGMVSSRSLRASTRARSQSMIRPPGVLCNRIFIQQALRPESNFAEKRFLDAGAFATVAE
jgi:hypothetical protein